MVGLAVNLQLANQLVDADPEAAKALLEELERDVQKALDETAQLAQRIYPPLLEAGGLVAALRSAAASAGVTASVEITLGGSVPPDVARTVYLCCLQVLEQASAGEATVTVRQQSGGVAFEVIQKDATPSRADGADAKAVFELLRDRVEALGGRLTIDSLPGGGARVAGSLPLPVSR